MPTIRILYSSLLAVALLTQPAFAQNKAAIGKSASEFLKLSGSLAASLADLTKRTKTASPNDKDMLKLVTQQLALVDATNDGVLALGVVAADLTIVKKHLANRCIALKSLTDGTGKYLGSLVSNIAAVATVAEVKKAQDIVVQLGQHALCNPGSGK